MNRRGFLSVLGAAAPLAKTLDGKPLEKPVECAGLPIAVHFDSKEERRQWQDRNRHNIMSAECEMVSIGKMGSRRYHCTRTGEMLYGYRIPRLGPVDGHRFITTYVNGDPITDYMRERMKLPSISWQEAESLLK